MQIRTPGRGKGMTSLLSFLCLPCLFGPRITAPLSDKKLSDFCKHLTPPLSIYTSQYLKANRETKRCAHIESTWESSWTCETLKSLTSPSEAQPLSLHQGGLPYGLASGEPSN